MYLGCRGPHVLVATGEHMADRVAAIDIGAVEVESHLLPFTMRTAAHAQEGRETISDGPTTGGRTTGRPSSS